MSQMNKIKIKTNQANKVYYDRVHIILLYRLKNILINQLSRFYVL